RARLELLQQLFLRAVALVVEQFRDLVLLQPRAEQLDELGLRRLRAELLDEVRLGFRRHSRAPSSVVQGKSPASESPNGLGTLGPAPRRPRRLHRAALAARHREVA